MLSGRAPAPGEALQRLEGDAHRRQLHLVPLSDHGLRQLAQAGEGDGRHLRCGRVLRPAGLQRVVPKLLAGEVVR